jgi:7,8-dihydroneopterin aldolase/epimerase/oxygenase
MFTISLHQIKVVAPIGLYPQEQILGNHFEVDIEVQVPNYSDKEFVDYTLLNHIVQQEMNRKEKILEQIALNIYEETKKSFSFASKIKISIRKLNPPMSGSMAYAQVVFEL